MKILVVGEHDGDALRSASLSCFTFARQLAQATGGSVTWLILGDQLDKVASQAAGLARVLKVESPHLAQPTAEPFGRAIALVARREAFDLVCAASTTFAKDILPRAAAELGGAMASDIVRYEWTKTGLHFDCPQFAGVVTATLRLVGNPQVVTVRASAYPPADLVEDSHPVARVQLDAAVLASRAKVVGLKARKSTRPDVTEAQVVVSGGGAVKTSEDFERLVVGLADVLGGAVGSSRALVAAGIAPTELLVGQTGKIVAPDLYVALGISGAVQHLAGMRNSRTIVAINSDPFAPIFDMADFSLVGDVYQVVPELIDKLRGRISSALK
jgi:electron transfer flavoprotein alpha subunit